MLAHMPREAVEKLIEANGLPEFTPQTLTDFAALFSDLETIAGRGWAFDNEERYTGMRCIASAVFDRQGAPVADVSISSPAALTAKAGRLVQATAVEITSVIGG